MPRQRSEVDDGGAEIPLDPVDAYKKDVDRSLLREQLRRSPDERVERMLAALRLMEELRAVGRRTPR